MPPSIVLEVLRILKGETDLRESTRVTEQTKQADPTERYMQDARELEQEQSALLNRLDLVVEKLEQLQIDEARNYGKPLQQLAIATRAMVDATDLLRQPMTGPPTIAAETEAIEALLITKRAGGGGGGGSGSTPGGGKGEGEADVPAALAGIGEQSMTEDREVAQASGITRSGIPAEFRAGLDAYFSAIDGGQ